MADLAPRWLHPEAAAAYVGRRVDELPRLVKRGLLPKPSFHFGPRSPRYDRLQLDALFTDASASAEIDSAVDEAVHEILGAARRPSPARGRQREGIPLRPLKGAQNR